MARNSAAGRSRDAAGRPLPLGHPDAVEPVPEQALPPQDALALARALLAQGRPFFAHDVLEAVWKASRPDERLLWQGLAQVCVGLTHLQRGNPVGGARLLRRGADRLEAHRSTGPSAPHHSVDLACVAAAARERAEAVDRGVTGPGLPPFELPVLSEQDQVLRPPGGPPPPAPG